MKMPYRDTTQYRGGLERLFFIIFAVAKVRCLVDVRQMRLSYTLHRDTNVNQNILCLDVQKFVFLETGN